MGISSALGPAPDLALSSGRLRYHDIGTGSPVVFVHGLLVNADLWRGVIPGLVAAGHRCLAPDWPLGSHSIPMPEADLTPVGLADLIAEFLDALDLTDVTIVASDTGGALTQILMTRHPERIGRVVLAAVDCFEVFPPQPFTTLVRLAKLPGAVAALLAPLRWRPAQRLPLAFGWVTKHALPRAIAESYLGPARRDPGIRADLRRFAAGVDARYTLAAAHRFAEVDLPVLVVWSTEDKLFPMSLAQRLVAALPRASLRTVGDSYTFLPEDQPELLTELIVEFTRLHAAP
ncbi:alpha/beta fold hydrolase [Nocardia caishijiensis]|uniref:Pimeloyl-ACP methyl ester carboxylesterase n=1 Tax=Nocardia caishijiensis TaxID=184756 RepID=A0ABQ6YJ27_9NOCA|nr:alpha/beta hydrolase [Nocardia caishijiensis]KAF0845785.1 pimeloyl-ACP methyl ester carboxylesterase [Nocardia caishijiensis]